MVLVPGGDYGGRCDGDSGVRRDSGSGSGWGREGGWGVGYLRQLAQAPADNLLGMYKRVRGEDVGVRREAAVITVCCTHRGGNRQCVLRMVFVVIWCLEHGGAG